MPVKVKSKIAVISLLIIFIFIFSCSQSDKSDYLAPRIEIIFPESNTTVSGEINIIVDADDDRGVKTVEYFIDGNSVKIDTAFPWEYRWNTTEYNDGGQHSIHAMAIDAAGNHNGISSLVYVTETTPPYAISRVNPDKGSSNTIFTFSSVESFDEFTSSDKLKVRWDWEADGVWDTPYIANKIVSHTFSGGGVYRTRLEVKDEHGLLGQSIVRVTVVDNGNRITDTSSHGSMQNDSPMKALMTPKLSHKIDLTIVPTTTPSLAVADNLIFIDGGQFQMGGHWDGFFFSAGNKYVAIVYSYYLAKYEVTISEFLKFMNKVKIEKNGYSRGRKLIEINNSTSAIAFTDSFTFRGNSIATNEESPVTEITWYGAIEFCNWLSRESGQQEVFEFLDDNSITWNVNANGYRLPTEAEWEYAARGRGSEKLPWSGCKSEDELRRYSWLKSNSKSQLHLVGSRLPNALGLYDMTGNAWEWCWDRYGTYPGDTQHSPRGSNVGDTRLIRGGGAGDMNVNARIANRSHLKPEGNNFYVGFRVAKNKS